MWGEAKVELDHQLFDTDEDSTRGRRANVRTVHKPPQWPRWVAAEVVSSISPARLQTKVKKARWRPVHPARKQEVSTEGAYPLLIAVTIIADWVLSWTAQY
jgi:hypothetical protein